MNIFTFIIGLVGPVMARWLASMGLGLVALTGAIEAFGVLKDQVVGTVNGLPSDALMLGGLYGCWEAIGIILGALTFALTWKGTSGFWRLAKK